MKFYLEMLLRSETCFAGSGGGRIGNVDIDLELDSQTGLPIIRGRTLKGLLLEELALILHTLEPVNPAGHWHIAAAHLFGTRGQTGYANLIFQDGRLPADVRATVQDNVRDKIWHREEVLAALTTVRHQTKVNVKTGAPEARSLRSSRVLRAGLRFRAPVHARQPLTVADRSLLAACAAAVRRVGLHRNHGWGEAQLRLLDADKQDVTAEWLAGLRQPPATAAITSPDIVESPIEPRPTTSAKQVLSYRLRLTTPAILAAVGGDFTTVETRPYISGSAVLGALAWRWLARQPDCPDPASNPDFQRCFLKGSVRWLNAYPEGVYDSRLLPCPLSLTQRKNDETGSAFDKVHLNVAETVQREPDTQWQPLNDYSFVRLQAPEETDKDEDEDEDEDEETEELRWRLYGRQPKMTPRLHHARDDREAGRSKDGQMFSYVALEAGEQFIGHILCDAHQDAAAIRDLLNAGPIPLGRSRTATYGGWARVELLSESDRETWQEAPQSHNQDQLVVTLLSDYLGVNDAGLPDPCALEQDLKTALGIDQPPIARFLGDRLVTGYVSHWRMPRPSHPAVKAGSVLVYRNIQPDPEKLKELYWHGVGVRRAEGFGRVAVNWHGAAEKMDAEEERVFFSGGDNDDDVIPTTLSPELNYLKRHLLFDVLQRVLIDYAVTCAGQVRHRPSAALGGRLRARVRTAASAQEVQDFLDQASLRPADKGLKKAGQALAQARLNQKSLTEWLRAWMLGDEQDPTPGWMRHSGVIEKCEHLRLSLDLLGPVERWSLLQAFLDSFCELLRRRAQEAATSRADWR